MLKKSKFTLGAISAGIGIALLSSPLAAMAGTMMAPGKESKEVVVEEKVEKKVVSGTLSLDVNTHFISYGLDVWGAGTEWRDCLFNPSLELTLALGGNFNFIIGTWWDVTDNTDSSIGDSVDEVDVWGGFGYTAGPVSLTLLYQEWMYAGDSERIVDFTIGVDTFLHPSLTVHGRVDGIGSIGQETGCAFVLGVEEGFDAGPVTFSFPVAVGFMTDNFQGGDGGFGYVSAGANASVPLPFLPGDWSAHAGVTYYHTNGDVIPSNPDEDFVTGNAGITLAF